MNKQVQKIEREQEIAAPADPMVSMIERIASDPNIPMDRLSAMMDMRERQMNKEAEQAFNEAFAAAMAEMPNVPRTGKNNHTGVRYSTLDDLIKATRPVLSRHGLSLNWQTDIDGDVIKVTAVVRHAKGHLIQTTLSGKRDTGKQMNYLQGGGSTETYLKRYSGFSILGLSSGDEVDNDGRGQPAETISADQFRELQGLLEKAGVDASIVCTAEGIENLQELPLKMLGHVRSKLEKTVAERAAA